VTDRAVYHQLAVATIFFRELRGAKPIFRPFSGGGILFHEKIFSYFSLLIEFEIQEKAAVGKSTTQMVYRKWLLFERESNK